MSAMKEIYTQLQEWNIDPETATPEEIQMANAWLFLWDRSGNV